jgi:hypothetical protein
VQLNNNDIERIERYYDGSLTAKESVAFHQQMQQDPEFMAEVEAWHGVLEGVRRSGRAALKAAVAGVGATVIASGHVAAYTPSIKPVEPKEDATKNPPKKRGSSFIGKLFRFLLLGIIGTGAYMWYTDNIPQEWLDLLKSNTPENTIDTSGTAVDTVYFEGRREEEAVEIEAALVETTFTYSRDTVWVLDDESGESVEIRIDDLIPSHSEAPAPVPDESNANEQQPNPPEPQHAPFP